MQYNTMNQTIAIPVSPVLREFLWTVLIYSSGHYIAFNCHTSLVSFFLRQFPSNSLSLCVCVHMFNDLWVLKSTGQAFCRMPSDLGLSDVFLWSHWAQEFSKKNPRSNVSLIRQHQRVCNIKEIHHISTIESNMGFLLYLIFVRAWYIKCWLLSTCPHLNPWLP